MQSTMDIEAVDDIGALLRALIEKPEPAVHDLERLRRAIYAECPIDRRRAAEIVHTNRLMRVKTSVWIEFYLETLVGYFLKSEGDRVVLSADMEEIVLSWFGHAASVADLGERRLILRLLLRPDDVSERFESWVLEAIEDNLLDHPVRWIGGEPRSPGVIDALDMQLIRRLVGGEEGHRRKPTSAVGIEFLLGLNRRAKRFVEHAHWRRLLDNSLARNSTRREVEPAMHKLE